MSSLIQTRPNTYHPGDSRSFSALAKDLALHVESLENRLKFASDALMVALALSAPIHQVPDEILLNVFEHLFYVPYRFEYRPECDSLPLLRRISLVCKRWRGIITCTPKFWTIIDVPQFMPRFSSYPISFALSTNDQVARAGNLPLTLLSSGRITEPILDTLSNYFHRITSIRIRLGERIVSDFFARFTDVPNLERLSVIIDEVSVDDDPPDLTVIFSERDFPRLAHIHFNFWLPLHQLSVPLPQLKTFDVQLADGNIPDPDPFSMISKLTRVERLHIGFKLSPKDQLPTNWSSLTLPCLHSLSLGWSEENISTQFLQTSHFPSLQHLSIGSTHTATQTIINSMRRPELWGITSLQFSFSSRSVVGAEFEDTLRQFKLLDTCKFYVGDCPGIADTTFRAMAQGLGEELFPRLKHLTIDAAHYHNQAFNPLQIMLRRRMSNVKVPFPERKALMTVIIDYARQSEWDRVRPGGLCKVWRRFKPSQYNDSMTSVEIGGQFDEGFLGEALDA